MKNLVACLIVVSLLTNCAIPLNSNYFNSTTKVGVIFVISPIQHDISGSGDGLVGALATVAVTSTDKYSEPLKIIEPELKANEKIKDLYLKSFSAKGKELVALNEQFDDSTVKSLTKFIAPKKTGKKYFKKDIRFLKEKYNIDEVLIVNANYGIRSHYKYGIESSKFARALITAQIVDLTNNSIIFSDGSISLIRLWGKWDTPPKYDKLRETINQALDSALVKESKRYK